MLLYRGLCLFRHPLSYAVQYTVQGSRYPVTGLFDGCSLILQLFLIRLILYIILHWQRCHFDILHPCSIHSHHAFVTYRKSSVAFQVSTFMGGPCRMQMVGGLWFQVKEDQNQGLASEITSGGWVFTGLSHTISFCTFQTNSLLSGGFGGIYRITQKVSILLQEWKCK